MKDHPSVSLAIQHRERIEGYEQMRERVAERLERAPEPDLKAAVVELAEIVAELCMSTAVRSSSSEDFAIYRELRHDAEAIARRLAS